MWMWMCKRKNNVDYVCCTHAYTYVASQHGAGLSKCWNKALCSETEYGFCFVSAVLIPMYVQAHNKEAVVVLLV